VVDHGQAEVQFGIEPEVVQAFRYGEAPVKRVDRTPMISRDEEVRTHVREDPSQPGSIIKNGRKWLRCADVLNHPVVLAEGHVRVAEV